MSTHPNYPQPKRCGPEVESLPLEDDPDSLCHPSAHDVSTRLGLLPVKMQFLKEIHVIESDAAASLPIPQQLRAPVLKESNRGLPSSQCREGRSRAEC